MRGSVSSTSSSMGHAPTTHPPTPPTSVLGPNTGTLRSGTSPYRTPAPPVNPPTVPAGYATGHPLAGAGSMGPGRESGYAPGSASVQATPPVRMVQPLLQQTSGYGSPLPPPMHDISQRPYISGRLPPSSCLQWLMDYPGSMEAFSGRSTQLETTKAKLIRGFLKSRLKGRHSHCALVQLTK